MFSAQGSRKEREPQRRRRELPAAAGERDRLGEQLVVERQRADALPQDLFVLEPAAHRGRVARRELRRPAQELLVRLDRGRQLLAERAEVPQEVRDGLALGRDLGRDELARRLRGSRRLLRRGRVGLGRQQPAPASVAPVRQRERQQRRAPPLPVRLRVEG